MTLRELGRVLHPFSRIRVIDYSLDTFVTLSETTWDAVLDDSTDLSPIVLDWDIVFILPTSAGDLCIYVRKEFDS